MFPKTATLFIVIQIAAVAKTQSSLIEASMPTGCNKNYCFTPSPHYPQELIDKLIVEEEIIEINEIEDRDGTDPSSDDCPVNKYYDSIYEIIDANDTVRYVIQTSKDKERGFQQKFRMEECQKPGPITSNTRNFNLNSTVLKSYNLNCVQTTLDYSFLVLSLDGKRTESVKAKGGIPVCCKCIVEES